MEQTGGDLGWSWGRVGETSMGSRKEAETEQDLVGPCWAQKPLLVPYSLFVGKRFQPPRSFLSSKGQIHAVTN